MTAQPCFSSAVGGNESVNPQHLYRMCKMCCKHVEEEGKKRELSGEEEEEEERKTVVIKAER